MVSAPRLGGAPLGGAPLAGITLGSTTLQLGSAPLGITSSPTVQQLRPPQRLFRRPQPSLPMRK